MSRGPGASPMPTLCTPVERDLLPLGSEVPLDLPWPWHVGCLGLNGLALARGLSCWSPSPHGAEPHLPLVPAEGAALSEATRPTRLTLKHECLPSPPPRTAHTTPRFVSEASACLGLVTEVLWLSLVVVTVTVDNRPENNTVGWTRSWVEHLESTKCTKWGKLTLKPAVQRKQS